MPIAITTTVRRVWRQARIHSRPAIRMARMTAALLIVAAGYLSFASSPASAAAICGTSGVELVVGNVYSCTYTTSGEDTFNAPLFVTAVRIVAVGQAGGNACAQENSVHTGTGGSGARVVATLPVMQPTLFVEVPPSTYGSPSQVCDAPAGFAVIVGGGGGGKGLAPGGGASVVQTCSVNSNCLLTGVPQTDPRLVVAGGGGGAAFKEINGGNAGAGANPTCNPGQSGQGAPVGAESGGGGSGGGCQNFGSGAAGGHGGLGVNGNSEGGFSANGQNGDPGGLPAGGAGGAVAVNPVMVAGCAQPWPGAGGGSGFLGGGGGGGAAFCNGGGGGGGSSFAGPATTGVSMTLAPSSATPSVTISWIRPTNREYQFLTGHAVGLSFTQSSPAPPVSVSYADTGSVQTSLTHTFSAPCVPYLNSPVGGTGATLSAVHVCAGVSTTGGNQFQSSSIATSQTRLLTFKIPGLPVVRALTVFSASKSTCAGSTGGTAIGFLEIGSDVVISHPQVIAPNTHLTIGQFQLNLNEQTPFTLPADKGLIVDAIQVSVGPPSSVTAHLIIASSESDIGDCPGEVNVP